MVNRERSLFFLGFFFSIIFAWPFVFGFELLGFTVAGVVLGSFSYLVIFAVNTLYGGPMAGWLVWVLAYLSVGLVAAISIFYLLRDSLGPTYDKIFDRKAL